MASRFDFSKEYILENERVRLMPMVAGHFKKLEEVAAEKEIWTYFLGASDGGKDFKSYVGTAVSERQLEKAYTFVVFDKLKNTYAGSTRFFDIDQELKIARLGYSWYGKDFRGTGLNKNCKYLLFEFAFEKIGFERIGLGAHAENKVSIAAMKSVGCTNEGSLRNLFPSIHGTGRADGVLLGLLREEWLKGVKKNLKNRL